jgi:dienelactone hydrolase
MRFRPVAIVALMGSLACGPGFAQEPPMPHDEIVLHHGLAISRVGRSGRSPTHTDAIEAQIVAGTWTAPKAGDSVRLPDGETRQWEPVSAGEDGTFEGRALAGGYCYLPVRSETRRVMLLEASGHSMVYVNGEPRVGDPYQTGMVRLPVLLQPGTNDLLFSASRRRLKAKLTAPAAAALLNTSDPTLPDLIAGQAVQTWGAVVVINATTAPQERLFLAASRESAAPVLTPVPTIPPLSVRKVGFRLDGPAPPSAGKAPVTLRLLRRQGSQDQTLDTAPIELRVRRPDETCKVTFRSAIDGSIQYYAVNPARSVRSDEGRARPGVRREPGMGAPALFLSLHGAGVEAIGQADAYSGKSWGHLVAPTNRRPYGFDWEDWGRLDAMEVLELAKQRLRPDPRRIYLTGHSMGGHGVWHVGATFPDRFAAIAPSAGWISFWSYAGARQVENPIPVEAMLRRAMTPSDTLSLARNYAGLGVYVLHGDADDNVPVGQARQMRQHLAGFHHDLVVHEQPGAGHWWDTSQEPGADCVDWVPLFDFFARRLIPDDASLREVEFRTASPGVSAWRHWAGILAQTHPLQISSVQLRWDPGLRRFSGTTDNVARLALKLDHVPSGQPLTVELDGQKLGPLPWPATARRLWLARTGERWSATAEPSPALKGPHRYGPFKEAFRNRMLFVYGTKGTPEENAWAFAKARYDAETFWVRGNGSVDIVADTAFRPSAERDRNVILYGSASTHGAWKALLADSPVQIRRGRIRLGDREETGEDLACLFLRPRPGSDSALVGVVSGSGLPGLRLTDRIPYFISGVAYPDCTLLGPETLEPGPAGIRAAGFFGPDWSLASSDFVWQGTEGRGT